MKLHWQVFIAIALAITVGAITGETEVLGSTVEPGITLASISLILMFDRVLDMCRTCVDEFNDSHGLLSSLVLRVKTRFYVAN